MRSRTLATAVSAALLSAGAAVALPAAAQAAAPVGPTLPIALTVSTPAKALQPGGPAESVIVKAANTTAKAANINLEDIGVWSGPLAPKAGSLSVAVTSEGATPASGTSVFQTAEPFGVNATVFPKGHPNGAFTIPAHTTFDWKVSVAVNKNWVVNDGKVDLWVTFEEQNQTLHGHGDYGAEFTVGNGGTGGPIVYSLAGGTKLSPGHPVWEKVTVTNHSGAALDEPVHFLPWGFVGNSVKPGTFAFYEWVGASGKVKAHWQAVPKTGLTVPSGLANNSSASVWFQLRVVSYTSKAPSERGVLGVYSPELQLTVQDNAFEQLTVLR